MPPPPARAAAAPTRPRPPSKPARARSSSGPTAPAAATPAPAAGRRSSSPAAASRVELSGGAPQTTNNRMEYTAALEGLRSLPAGSRACVVTDSRLMLDSMTKWIHGWKRKGWKTAAGDPVKNQDLVRALDAEIARHEAVRWHWVRGHETGAAARAQGAQRPRRPARGRGVARCACPQSPAARAAAAAAAWRSASSANEHSALTSRICSTVLQRAHSSRGEQTTTASACARETATLSRLRLNRKSIPRGTSSPLEVVIEKNTTGACWPWNLSTVPTRAPRGQPVAQVAHLGVVGRDDEDVVERELALGARARRCSGRRRAASRPPRRSGRPPRARSGGSRRARPRAAARPRPTARARRRPGAPSPRPAPAAPSYIVSDTKRQTSGCIRQVRSRNTPSAGRDRLAVAEQVLEHGHARAARVRALAHVGELLRVAEQHHPARGAGDRQRVGERHLARLVDEQHVDRRRASPRAPTATACRRSGSRPSPGRERGRCRREDVDVRALVVPTPGCRRRTSSARGTRARPPPPRARPRRAGCAIALCEVAATPTRMPAAQQLADQPRARVGLAGAGRALDEQRRAAEAGDPLAERRRRAAAAAAAAAARTRGSAPEIAPVACSASARSAACCAVCGIGLGGISARRQRLVERRLARA